MNTYKQNPSGASKFNLAASFVPTTAQSKSGLAVPANGFSPQTTFSYKKKQP